MIILWSALFGISTFFLMVAVLFMFHTGDFTPDWIFIFLIFASISNGIMAFSNYRDVYDNVSRYEYFNPRF